jgi:hypothetical protein
MRLWIDLVEELLILLERWEDVDVPVLVGT